MINDLTMYLPEPIFYFFETGSYAKPNNIEIALCYKLEILKPSITEKAHLKATSGYYIVKTKEFIPSVIVYNNIILQDLLIPCDRKNITDFENFKCSFIHNGITYEFEYIINGYGRDVFDKYCYLVRKYAEYIRFWTDTYKFKSKIILQDFKPKYSIDDIFMILDRLKMDYESKTYLSYKRTHTTTRVDFFNLPEDLYIIDLLLGRGIKTYKALIDDKNHKVLYSFQQESDEKNSFDRPDEYKSTCEDIGGVRKNEILLKFIPKYNYSEHWKYCFLEKMIEQDTIIFDD